MPSGAIVLSEMELDKLDDTDTIQKAAIILKTVILKIEPKKLSNNNTVTNLIEEECTIPDILNNFFTTLLGSTNSRRESSPQQKRLAKSFAEDEYMQFQLDALKF